jgi:hypothetical protein
MVSTAQLLVGITFSFPFLVVRIIYSLLSTFATSTQLQAFRSFGGGSWVPFFFMGILMELIVVCIYIYFGLTLPLSVGDDERRQLEFNRAKWGKGKSSYEMTSA